MTHLVDGQFQSDKYEWCERGFVPMKVTDRTAQPMLWAYAQSRRAVDPQFANDLEKALRFAGFVPVGHADVRPIVVRMAAAMEARFAANDQKNGRPLDWDFLVIKLLEEVHELAEATYVNLDDDLILREAADVANVAALIVAAVDRDFPGPEDR